MGSLVCCCRSRSNGDAAESEATDGSTGEGEQEGVAVSDLALRVGNTGLDALIALGEVVPVVGDFFGLIEVFKDRCGDLSARIDEAKELARWEREELYLLEMILTRVDRSKDPLTQMLRQAVKRYANSIKHLKAEAERITADGSKCKQCIRGVLYQGNFESAKEAVEEAKKGFRLALEVDTWVTVHGTFDLILRGNGTSGACAERILPNVLPDDCEMVSYDVEADAGSATAGLRVKNIAAATELRDEVLKPGGLLAKAGVQGVSVDRGAFLESYAEAVMRFTELTAHQKDKLADVRDAVVSVLLAPAGSGKTFVAVQRMAEVLNSDPKAKVLFVARNTALALFACKWLVAASRATQRIVERVHVLVDPFLKGPRRVSVMIDGARLRLALDPVLAGAEGYRLIVVDEAHHLAGEPKLHEQLKKVKAAEATLLFLSDGSQATKASLDAEEIARSLVELPRESAVAVATLSEVVRSTKRIVAGASAFQLEAGRKAEMSTHTLSPGPPLVARIFRLADEDEGERYAQEVVEAIVAVRHQLADLEDLNDRIAVVCPDGTFRKMLQKPLAHALKGRFDVVDAATASSVLPRAETTVRSADAKAWLILDIVDNMDGLERLVVICVGLDQVIDRGAGVLETRSRLYRAMTRAQLAVAVVNEVLPGGWLEFLGRVELNADGGFDDAAEREKRADNAADDVVGMIVAETETTSVERPEQSARNNGDESEQGFSDNGSSDLDAVNQSDSDAVFLADEAPIIEEIRSAPYKVLQSIWDASAVATVSRGDLRFMPFSEGVDLSKLAELRTLEGHSESVRCGVHCTIFVMIWLRRRSMALPCCRTGGASCPRQTT